MKAMILAAGRGERMKPLTDVTPKPLLKIAGIPLLEYHIVNLKRAGIYDLVINHAWLGQQIADYFGDGKKWGVNIVYSVEQNGALETAGGIIKALPLLGEEPFLLVNGDIYCDYDFAQLNALAENELAHLVLVPNPDHVPLGNFALIDGKLDFAEHLPNKHTYAGIGLYDPKLFAGMAAEFMPLAPILRQAMSDKRIGGHVFNGLWSDIGTVERLTQINQIVKKVKD
ncbi:N-acetylmuramate alpha-1-phosphate uridylyltransferase MurU [Thalassotalea aquiviva]|uniref:N-acetylmuramate alpha-1-phosphate uridylyltransferase MurU n=1 Tax=Thalassotalea aquiviva TaxID=3242415 RepID=UPI00352B8793